MARYRRKSRGSYQSNYGYRSHDIGWERALQHIEEAKELSRELGGTDKDVKAYFFSIPLHQLKTILDEYEAKYGRKAREYAERTLPKWRSGQVTMSGQNASRLFELIPPRMPLEEKYKLTENLWRHVGPNSRKTLRIGLDANIEDAIEAVRDHIEKVVIHYKIPADLERRFNWLSAGDVDVKQELLNHLRQMERTFVVDGAKTQLPVMLEHLISVDGRNTHRLAQILKVGNHELEILIDKNISGVKLEDPLGDAGSITASSNFGYIWLLWLIGIAIVIILLAQ
ncbi:hypothetical protein [Oceanibacterium hippocampi]|uniref:Uncharacterized protein n=1 Tax=Oceanibacterium hippocampi TaxID=745714 RepID=A0A1Y5TZN5_9PROT|nr:hypothetical protein [Oceanibacterium hippocampi]SLN72318.1 hypothetical protein OCH7691_03456 [Oceanibacterium hippocampi]